MCGIMATDGEWLDCAADLGGKPCIPSLLNSTAPLARVSAPCAFQPTPAAWNPTRIAWIPGQLQQHRTMQHWLREDANTTCLPTRKFRLTRHGIVDVQPLLASRNLRANVA